ncbi:unnamed protein product [Phytomonas sp. Hart1]|nr:unnamed protein product [Phytomonas sp. Hart1]|eukprot:CCW66665.1 unnamed protein product [Phytomonas sp. isolate Hart1]
MPILKHLKRNWATKEFGGSFTVGVIPTLRDNFSYLIHDRTSGAFAVVDLNTDLDPVLRYIQAEKCPPGASKAWAVGTILTTHKHWDHAGGNAQGVRLRGGAEGGGKAAALPVIVGGARENVPGATKTVREGDSFALGGLRVEVLDVPCHTTGHVAYKVFNPARLEDGIALFTGDTMFIAGIGAFFEGTAQDMCAAMAKIYQLNASVGYEMDAKTFIFPGHEYTVGFMKFSEANFPLRDHADYHFIRDQLESYQKAVEHGVPTVPSSLSDEKRQNLFLRVVEDEFRHVMKRESEVKLMDYLYNICD